MEAIKELLKHLTSFSPIYNCLCQRQLSSLNIHVLLYIVSMCWNWAMYMWLCSRKPKDKWKWRVTPDMYLFQTMFLLGLSFSCLGNIGDHRLGLQISDYHEICLHIYILRRGTFSVYPQWTLCEWENNFNYAKQLRRVSILIKA